MKISRQVIDLIQEIFERQKALDGTAWYVILKNKDYPWGANDLKRWMRGAVADPDDKTVLEVISDTGNILEITGISPIHMYANNDSPEIINAESKRWFYRNSKDSALFPNKFKYAAIMNVESEIPLEGEPRDWIEVPKWYVEYRIKTFDNGRYSVMKTRYSSNNSISMRFSDINTQPFAYEFRMNIRPDDTPMTILQDVVRAMGILEDTEYLMTLDESAEVLREYMDLIRNYIMEERFDWKRQRLQRERRRGGATGGDEEIILVTPKPITLERINLIDPSKAYGRPTIQNGYCVTEKADGERMLLYINRAGRAFFINNTKDVKDTGIKFANPELRGTLMDGEYVPVENMRDPNADRPIFAIFDIYFINGGESVYHLPLLAGGPAGARDRVYYMKKYATLCSSPVGGPIEFMAKEHRHGEGREIFEACKSILENEGRFKYHIDGLIFTPAKMAVFGFYPLTKIDKPKKIPRTSKWDRVLKWKPENQNTIDFLVKTDGVPRKDIVGKEYIQLELYVGYSLKQKEPITVFEGIKLLYDEKYRTRVLGDNTDENPGERNAYVARKFEPVGTHKVKNAFLANIYKQEDGTIRTTAGEDIIMNNTIVEFSFNLSKLKTYGSDTGPWCWEPLRVRDDKTRKYMSEMATDIMDAEATEMPKQTANDFRVAMGVWRSIHEPVNQTMITEGLGNEEISKDPSPDSDDAVYYVETNIPRNELLSVTMTKYHNQIIKHMLYNKADTDALLDIACGKGGDINRYRSPHFENPNHSFKFVLGIDLYHDNIENPMNGAYARLINLKIEQQSHMRSNILFVVGNAAHTIANGVAPMKISEPDHESREILEFLYTQRDVPLKIRQAFANNRRVIETLHGIAANRFSMVSCMFAIHYFFDSEYHLRNFLQNVANNLKLGGLFVSTFMDGKSVHELLNQTVEDKGFRVNNGTAEGITANGIRVWAIKSGYDRRNPEIGFGREIKVFIESINQLYPEYLVDFGLLEKYAAEYGLSVVQSHPFTDLLDQTILNADEGLSNELDFALKQKGLKYIYQNMQRADPALRKFSSLNRWAVFEKRH